MHTTHAHPHTPRHTLACRQAGRQADKPFLQAELSAQCWESLVACMPVASWWESRKTCCCFRGCWPVCHLFQGNRRLQEINPVENTHRDNDGKRQQSENVWLKWKPRREVLIMSFLNKLTLNLKEWSDTRSVIIMNTVEQKTVPKKLKTDFAVVFDWSWRGLTGFKV